MFRTRPGAALIVALFTILGLLAGCGSKPAAPAPAPAAAPAAAPAPAPAPAPQPPVKIGAIFAATGPASSLGKPERDTVLMLADQINKNGGIKGRKVEVVFQDTESDETKSRLAMKKLAEDKDIVAIVGGTTSGESLAMLPEAETNQITFISVAAAASIINPVKKWVFKTPATDREVITAIVNLLKQKNLSKVAWASVNSAYGDGGRAEFQKLVGPNNLTVVADERFGATDTDMTAQATRMKAASPDAIVVWATPPSASVMAKNINQLGIKAPQFQSHGIANQAFIDQAKEAAEGVIFPAQKLAIWDTLADSDPVKKVAVPYVSDFQKTYNYFPTTFGSHAWDAFMMVVKAVENAGTDRAKIRDYIENLKDFVGAGGVFNTSATDHLGLSAKDIAIVTIKGGKWVAYSG